MSLSLRFDEFFQFFKYQFAAAEIRVLSELGQFQKIVKSMCVICVRDSTKALKASLCLILAYLHIVFTYLLLPMESRDHDKFNVMQ